MTAPFIVPALLGLKAFKILKFEKAVLAAPLAMLGAKVGLISAKYNLAKSAFKAAGRATTNVLDLPGRSPEASLEPRQDSRVTTLSRGNLSSGR